MVQKATTIGPELVSDYTICHHNWQYPFLVPSDEECIATYHALHGKDAHASDVDESEESEGFVSGGESDAEEAE